MKIILKISFLLLLTQVSFAQNKSDYIWLFSNDYTDSLELMEGSVIDFNNGKRDTLYVPLAFEQGPTNASICDPETGRLLFYTNGCAIADSTHQIMLNGNDINPGELHDNWCGEGFDYPQKNTTIILDIPQSENEYYVFHQSRVPDNAPAMGLLYSKVDMSGNGGLGEVIFKNEELIEYSKVNSSYMTACRKPDSNGWWLIVMGYPTNDLIIYSVTNQGVEAIDTVEQNTAFSAFTNGGGHSCFSPDGNTFAWYNPFDNFHVYDFDRETGKLSNYQSVDVPEYTVNMEFYGSISISPSNQFAYLSSDYQMYQVDLWANDLQESLTLIAEWDGFGDPFPTGFSSIMHGPDCKMYVASGASVKHLGVIHYPDNKGMDCEFKQHDLELPWHKNVGNVPNFPHFRIDEEAPCDDMITTTSYIPDYSTLKIKVIPNPTTHQLYFSFPEVNKEKSSIYIYNGMGELVKEVPIKKHLLSKNVDVSDLSLGIYFFKFSSNQVLLGSGSFIKS